MGQQLANRKPGFWVRRRYVGYEFLVFIHVIHADINFFAGTFASKFNPLGSLLCNRDFASANVLTKIKDTLICFDCLHLSDCKWCRVSYIDKMECDTICKSSNVNNESYQP